ncbi:MAG: radical SAM protein [Candidatus Aminicenantes bacterium]|nr:radical SAM protein [Candidatus Aminicenantes bacterium]
MDYSPLNYDMPLFRPPSEARSLIFQVTFGCSWNQCGFCEMYPDKQFRAKSETVIRQEIIEAATVLPQARKIFLADGNAMVLSFRRLQNILNDINRAFPEVSRISTYALPQDILSKSSSELNQLQKNGLKLIYLGIESGDDEVLKVVNKGETFESTRKGLLKAKQAGIKTSVMILTGLGGKKFLEPHAINSAKIVNLTQPDYLSTLVLMFPHGLNHYKKKFADTYIPLTLEDTLREMDIFLSHTELERTVFRSDHASNYLTLKGVLSRDKNHFLGKIRNASRDPGKADLRPEWLRGL